MKVLIADDSKEVGKRLVEMLSRLPGVQVVGPASDGTAAWDLYQLHAPAVAVLDLQMPGLSGLEVLALIRRRDSVCVVIILTNHAQPSIGERCLAAGADYFLRKSAEFEKVAEIVQQFLEVHQ